MFACTVYVRVIINNSNIWQHRSIQVPTHRPPQGPVTIEHAEVLENVSWRAFYLHRVFASPPDPNGVRDGARHHEAGHGHVFPVVTALTYLNCLLLYFSKVSMFCMEKPEEIPAEVMALIRHEDNESAAVQEREGYVDSDGTGLNGKGQCSYKEH